MHSFSIFVRAQQKEDYARKDTHVALHSPKRPKDIVTSSRLILNQDAELEHRSASFCERTVGQRHHLILNLIPGT